MLHFDVEIDTHHLRDEINLLDKNLDSIPQGTINEMQKMGRRSEIAGAIVGHWDQIWKENSKKWQNMNSDGWNKWKEENTAYNDGLKATGESLRILKSGRPAGGERGGYGRSWTTRTHGQFITIEVPPKDLLVSDIKDGRPRHTLAFWQTYDYKFAGETDIPFDDARTFPTASHNTSEPREWNILHPDSDLVALFADVFSQAAERAWMRKHG